MSRKRIYRCKLPANSRFMYCKKGKASKACLKAGVWGDRCPKLVISYK